MSAFALPKRLRSIPGRIGLSLAVLVALLIACELGFRTLLALAGDPYSAADTRTLVFDLAAEINGVRRAGNGEPATGQTRGRDGRRGEWYVLHPYLGYDVPHGHEQIQSCLANPDDYTIVLLGGSVAANFSDDELGAEKVLLQLLDAKNELGGRRVRVLNFARVGYKQPQQQIMLSYLLGLGCRPDVVVNLDGFNELVLSDRNAESGFPASYPSINHWGHLAQRAGVDREGVDLMIEVRAEAEEAERIADRAERYGLFNSAFGGRFAVSRMRRTHARWATAQDGYVRHAAGLEDAVQRTRKADPAAAELEASVRAWSEASFSIELLCRGRSIRYVHLLQPALYDPGAKPLAPSERARFDRAPADQSRLIARGYDLMRARGPELCERGVEFHDFSGIFADVEDRLYHDIVHFGTKGNTILARRLAAVLLDGAKVPDDG